MVAECLPMSSKSARDTSILTSEAVIHRGRNNLVTPKVVLLSVVLLSIVLLSDVLLSVLLSAVLLSFVLLS